MLKNSQKKGPLSKEGGPNGGVKKVKSPFGRIKCNAVELDCEISFMDLHGMCHTVMMEAICQRGLGWCMYLHYN